QIISEELVVRIVTSDVYQMHYFFVSTGQENENVYKLKHTDLLKADFSRLERVSTKMPVDVSDEKERMRRANSGSCSLHRRKSYDILSNRVITFFQPEITDAPLSNNIYASHYRSSYPFVKSGRTIERHSYFILLIMIIVVIVIGLFSRWIALGYDVFPRALARKIRMKL
ncbi:hypothetical protein PMAYCL1PPCAC_02285, partial [Pristionchus mayeri]